MARPTRATLLFGCLALLPLLGAAAPPPLQPPQCRFDDYIFHEGVSSWEFQLDCPPDKAAGSRHQVLAAMEAALLELEADKRLAFYINRDTMRTSVISQVNYAISTLDGRPLFPSARTPDRYAWRGPAFMRHRTKLSVQWGANQFHNDTEAAKLLQVGEGHADLTLKAKDVDLDAFHLIHEDLRFKNKVDRRAFCSTRSYFSRYINRTYITLSFFS
jgi:hypothetical protein